MSQISCSNCGNQKNEKLRACPHCKAQFFPCRQCKTLIEIKKHRLVEKFTKEEWTEEVGDKYTWNDSTKNWDHSLITMRVKDKITRYSIKEMPCSICNTRKPFKRFGNTLVGGLILSLLILTAHILGILMPLGALIFILCIDYVGKLVFRIPYWWVIYLLLIILIINFVPVFFVFLIKAIFGDMLGIPLDGLYHWERRARLF